MKLTAKFIKYFFIIFSIILFGCKSSPIFLGVYTDEEISNLIVDSNGKFKDISVSPDVICLTFTGDGYCSVKVGSAVLDERVFKIKYIYAKTKDPEKVASIINSLCITNDSFSSLVFTAASYMSNFIDPADSHDHIFAFLKKVDSYLVDYEINNVSVDMSDFRWDDYIAL